MISQLKHEDTFSTMQLKGVEELKRDAKKILFDKLKQPVAYGSSKSTSQVSSVPFLGIHRRNKDNYQMTVYVAKEADIAIAKQIFNNIPENNIHFEVTGSAIPYSSPIVCTGNAHSVCMGDAVSHFKSSGQGTLGCLVRKRDQLDDLFILSNNHVLANLNKGLRNQDSILLCTHTINSNKSNRGKRFVQILKKIKFLSFLNALFDVEHDSHLIKEADYYIRETSEIGVLADFIELKGSGVINFVDAAIAKLNKPIIAKLDSIKGVGPLKGFYTKEQISLINSDLRFTKIGQKSKQTWGTLDSFSLTCQMEYDKNDPELKCSFDDIISFKSINKKPFSEPGDSGSLILDKNGLALGLLFGGTDFGGSDNCTPITYAIPLCTILEALNVDLVLER